MTDSEGHVFELPDWRELVSLETFVERQRIARDLHDSAGQDLFATKMSMRRLESALAAQSADCEEALQEAHQALELIDSAIGNLKHTVWNLHRDPSRERSLSAHIKALIEDMKPHFKTPVTLRAYEVEPHVQDFVLDQLCWIGREAVMNALKHADAILVEVTLRFSPSRISMLVEDDGCGFDPQGTLNGLGRGFGMVSMSERASLIGASIEFSSSRGRGTAVRVTVPVNERVPAGRNGVLHTDRTSAN